MLNQQLPQADNISPDYRNAGLDLAELDAGGISDIAGSRLSAGIFPEVLLTPLSRPASTGRRTVFQRQRALAEKPWRGCTAFARHDSFYV